MSKEFQDRMCADAAHIVEMGEIGVTADPMEEEARLMSFIDSRAYIYEMARLLQATHDRISDTYTGDFPVEFSDRIHALRREIAQFYLDIY